MVIKIKKRRRCASEGSDNQVVSSGGLSNSTKSTIIGFFEYILCFFMIICTTSIWLHFGIGYTYRGYIRFLVPVLCLAICVFEMLFRAKSTIAYEALIYIGCVVFCFLPGFISQYPNYSTTIYLVLIILCFILMAYLYDTYEMKDFWKKYVNLITLIAAISLFFWLFGSILEMIGSSGTITYEWDGTRNSVNYYNIYYAPTGQLADTLIYGMQRNCGIFTEGTMFAFQLVIAFMMEMRSFKGRLFVKIILIITLISTFSTTGIIAIVLYCGICLVFSDPNSRFLKICKILFLPLIIVIGIIGLAQLALTKMTTGSYGIRYDHIISCFQTFIKTFPIGLGYGGSGVLQSYYYYDQGTAVGIPLLFAYGGLGGALLIIVPTILYVYRSVKERNWEGLAFSITFTWIYFFTNVVTSSVLPWVVTVFVYLKEGYEMKKSFMMSRGGVL